MDRAVTFRSARLLEKLSAMLSAQFTLVTAPPGYGKTTAVREFLRESLKPEEGLLWLTITSDDPCGELSAFCAELECPLAFQRFEEGDFSADSFYGWMEELAGGRFTGFITIDNLERLGNELSERIVSAIFKIRSRNIKFVLIAQRLDRKDRSATGEVGVHHIGYADLELNAAEIVEYCRESGKIIDYSLAEEIYEYTGGWALAIAIQCKRIRAGIFEPAPETLTMIQRLVWNSMGIEERRLLLRLSFFDSFTEKQVCFLLGEETLPDWCGTLFTESNFIRYDWETAQFIPHKILLKQLRMKLEELPDAFYEECVRTAGDWFLSTGRDIEAVGLYYRLRDYEMILQTGLVNMVGVSVEGRVFGEIAAEIATCCDRETKKRNFIAMLRIAYILFGSGKSREFEALMAELDSIITGMERDGTKMSSEASSLRGEWTLISAFSDFPDAEKMLDNLTLARQLIGGRSRTIADGERFLFGTLSIAFIFTTRPGKADHVAGLLSDEFAIYSELTGGGIGANSLYRAEVAFLRGDVAEMHTRLYSVLYESKSSEQDLIPVSAQRLLEYTQHSSVQGEGGFSEDVEMRILDYMGSSTDSIGQESDKYLSITQRLNSALSRLGALLEKGRYAQLAGEAEAMIDEFSMYGGGLFEALLRLYLAAGYASFGSRGGARREVEKAIDMTFPDRFYTPFVFFSKHLGGAGEDYVHNRYPAAVSKIKELREAMASQGNEANAKRAVESLTNREYEVAKLAAQGYRNREIADKLQIGEKTVRTHLGVVFRKLMIDRRAKLSDYISDR